MSGTRGTTTWSTDGGPIGHNIVAISPITGAPAGDCVFAMFAYMLMSRRSEEWCPYTRVRDTDRVQIGHSRMFRHLHAFLQVPAVTSAKGSHNQRCARQGEESELSCHISSSGHCVQRSECRAVGT